jgi:hypothetical protein
MNAIRAFTHNARKTYHGSFLYAPVHLDPSDVLGLHNLADVNVAPFPASKLWVGMLVSRRRMVEEILNGGLRQGRVPLARRRRDVAQAFDEALSVR